MEHVAAAHDGMAARLCPVSTMHGYGNALQGAPGKGDAPRQVASQLGGGIQLGAGAEGEDDGPLHRRRRRGRAEARRLVAAHQQPESNVAGLRAPTGEAFAIALH